MGLNFLWRDGARSYVGGATNPGTQAGEYLRGGTSGLHIPGTDSASGPPFVSAPGFGGAFNLFFSTGIDAFPFSAILSIMSQEGLAKVLAEPTLVALSGQDAEFHAGGEVPILIARQLGEVSVEYKKFGVRLKFNPTVLGEGTMSLKLAVEVSEPDPTSGVTLGGFNVPGFRSRSSETTVRIKDGQSFAVAGLLSESVRSTVSKIPLLGDLPVLGALFRSTAYQREETELLVVVRAFLVRPQQPNQLPLLPGEGEYTDPSDFGLFLMGRLHGGSDDNTRKRDDKRAVKPTGGPSGPIGFERKQN
jgi:pilus assembly protein CpaC